MNAPRPIIPLILSGGSGTRLWPLSRTGRPKQLQPLVGNRSMLAQTARRVARGDLFAAPIIVGSADHADLIEAEVPALQALILEPCARNTAPAIALAALNVESEDLLLVLPSDHLIADEDARRSPVAAAAPFAREGWIMTFGMRPDKAETGYGYIQRGKPLAEGIFTAERFVEKPRLDDAKAYVASGDYDWNGGIFLMRADVLLEGLGREAPAILDAARRAVEGQVRQGLRILPDSREFAACPSQSIDYALMEKARKVAVVPARLGWSDIGGWAALHEIAGRNGDDNALVGEVIALDSRGCLIRSDGPLVAAIGVEDLVIVATGDAVLVVPKNQAQRVKDVVEQLKQEGRDTWL
jgi:mannose-1-phosphate guanylyltransferase/mannose-1-phosphate guanylyltransferase/mannose-6-phosphate isomerase